MLPSGDELRIIEERAEVGAHVPASGSWPPAGTTVDLYMLKRAVTKVTGEVVELHALDGAVVVYGDRWHVRLNLLVFGPESRRPVPPIASAVNSRVAATTTLADLPPFQWAKFGRGLDPDRQGGKGPH